MTNTSITFPLTCAEFRAVEARLARRLDRLAWTGLALTPVFALATFLSVTFADAPIWLGVFSTGGVVVFLAACVCGILARLFRRP